GIVTLNEGIERENSFLGGLRMGDLEIGVVGVGGEDGGMGDDVLGGLGFGVFGEILGGGKEEELDLGEGVEDKGG
uniref:hypothetical protein n=1 Tax=Neisseria sicca TaxID=490 RepID=UPI001C990D6D